MFGCCVAGRLLQTNLQQIDETHALFELPHASTINHVCVFLLGTVPFPDGYAATVHFFWPGKGFQLLGMLSNEKPSAIFRLRGTFTSTPASSNTQNAFTSTTTANSDAEVTAVLGISIEPLEQVQAQVSTLNSALVKPAQDLTKDPSLLATRIVQHLFNYVSSFIDASGTASSNVMVPMGVITNAILLLRLWVMWENDKRVLAGLFTLFGSMTLFQMGFAVRNFSVDIYRYEQINDRQWSGCTFSSSLQYSYLLFVVNLIPDIVVLVLALIPTIRLWLLFYIYECLISAICLAFVATSPNDRMLLMVPLFIVVRMILSTRMILHTRALYIVGLESSKDFVGTFEAVPGKLAEQNTRPIIIQVDVD
ncbi:hypothetical protein NP233_g8322 [Leucocoprinus birnbaumii]|uniref:Uncharacterized protein n=1 Tax=Leucocoprinus birnbaumii TaxID=56174 RepID=A0AAD5YN94_9AGAR|nr:hypothetical protein NP233_g8322 [Leucocoprinus birnbaumii]